MAKVRRSAKAPPPPRLYSMSKMPRVDVHVHLHDMDAMAKYRRKLKSFGLDVAVSLGFQRSAAMVDEIPAIDKRFGGRILYAPGHGFPRRAVSFKGSVWWSMSDVARFKAAGAAGVKIYANYVRGLTKKSIMSRIRRQGELGLPLIGLHICDPPTPGWWHPNYWDCIYEAERVIAGNKGTTFIMAHGFWLMNDDKGLDVLDGFFCKYPHLNVDLSAVYQWWSPPEPTYEKLRDFIVRWKDRLLYGTDGNANYSSKAHYRDSYRMLETLDENCHGFFGGQCEPTYIKGLGLSKEVLNRIYWWNAARLIPRVGESLRKLGY